MGYHGVRVAVSFQPSAVRGLRWPHTSAALSPGWF